LPPDVRAFNAATALPNCCLLVALLEPSGDAADCIPTPFSDEREQIVYEMAICLSNARWAPKGLYDRAVKALGMSGSPM